jgi:hypothetical protein
MPHLWRSRSHPRRHASVSVQRAVEDHLGRPVRSTFLGVKTRGEEGKGAARLKTTFVVYLNGLDTGACIGYHPV